MKGILMRPWKIKAIAEHPDIVTVTRRVIKPQPVGNYVCKCPGDDVTWSGFEMPLDSEHKRGWIPYPPEVKPCYQVGETVYIKEAWRTLWIYDDLEPTRLPGIAPIYFKDIFPIPNLECLELGRWRSPLHLRADHARYFIQITGVRAERLQEITLDDVLAEGTPRPPNFSLTPSIIWYKVLWDSINKDYQWAPNPWVWVYSFRDYILGKGNNSGKIALGGGVL